jgi:clan AA aspartic protease (TIGR02281 family)
VIALLAGVICSDQHQSMAAQLSDDDHRLVGQLNPDFACYVNATVGSVQFRMLVDTGSSDLAFNCSHLRKVGLNSKRLSYDQPVSTSDGIIRSAPIVVHELHIGAFVLRDVQATVELPGARAAAR